MLKKSLFILLFLQSPLFCMGFVRTLASKTASGISSCIHYWGLHAGILSPFISAAEVELPKDKAPDHLDRFIREEILGEDSKKFDEIRVRYSSSIFGATLADRTAYATHYNVIKNRHSLNVPNNHFMNDADQDCNRYTNSGLASAYYELKQKKNPCEKTIKRITIVEETLKKRMSPMIQHELAHRNEHHCLQKIALSTSMALLPFIAKRYSPKLKSTIAGTNLRKITSGVLYHFMHRGAACGLSYHHEYAADQQVRNKAEFIEQLTVLLPFFQNIRALTLFTHPRTEDRITRLQGQIDAEEKNKKA